MKAQDYKISAEKFVFHSTGENLHDTKLETKPVTYFRDAINRFCKNKASIVAAIIMWLIGKRDVKQIVLVSVLVPLAMWLVFYKLLTVNIPMGVLQPLKNLVDMI